MAGNGEGDSSQTIRSEAPEGVEQHFAAEVVAKCESVVSAYRKGDVGRATAFRTLASILDRRGDYTEEELNARDQALESYIHDLDEVDKERIAAKGKGRAPAEPRDQAGSPGTARVEEEETSGDASEFATAPRHRRRPGEPESSADTDSEPDAGSLGGSDQSTSSSRSNASSQTASESASQAPSKRRRKVDETKFAFFNRKHRKVSRGSKYLRKILALKENYTRDVAYTKQAILNQLDTPAISESSWTDVICGRAVDLNKYFTELVVAETSNQQTFKFGGLELTAPESNRATRQITEQGHWVSAWARYSAAVVFLYPLRRRELAKYGDYISNLFTQAGSANVRKVLAYDRAIRSEVARGNRYILTDYSAWVPFYTRCFIAGGDVDSASGSGTSKSGTSAHRPICRKFNEERCSTPRCKYRHICLKCRDTDDIHPAARCPTSRASGSGRADGGRK